MSGQSETYPPKVVFLSENVQLGGLTLIALARLHNRGEIQLVACWSSDSNAPETPLGANDYSQLMAAKDVKLPRSASQEGALFGGVPIGSYATLCNELRVKHHFVPNVNGGGVAGALKALGVSVGVVVGHGQIFRDALLQAPKMGWVNAHPSLLPRHRGPMPGFWELRGGDAQSGVTLHLLSEQVDSGPLLCQEAFEISLGMTFQQLVETQARVSAELTTKSLLSYLSGELEVQQQPDGGSYEGFPQARDALISASMTRRAAECFALGMRSVSPAIVSDGKQLWTVEGVVESRPSETEQGLCRVVGSDRLEVGLSDGVITFLVAPFQPGSDENREQS